MNAIACYASLTLGLSALLFLLGVLATLLLLVAARIRSRHGRKTGGIVGAARRAAALYGMIRPAGLFFAAAAIVLIHPVLLSGAVLRGCRVPAGGA